MAAAQKFQTKHFLEVRDTKKRVLADALAYHFDTDGSNSTKQGHQ